MNDRLDELAVNVDDALINVDELEQKPGGGDKKTIAKVRERLEDAKERVDELANEDDG